MNPSGPPLAEAWRGLVQLPEPQGGTEAFERELYGPIPAAPDTLSVRREPLAEAGAERLQIEMSVDGRVFTVDAALWLPSERPAPLVAGLDFIGPAGILSGEAFPLDPDAIVRAPPEFGLTDGRLHEVLRGSAAESWPVKTIRDAGFAVLVSCYGSWVPDSPERWRDHGVFPLAGVETRAISLWAWAIQRLIDAALSCPEIDPDRVAVAGHSRLGKAALWAAANDPRIGAVLANASGAAGAAPAAHPVGETLAELRTRFPHWILPGDAFSADQHALLSLVAPRKLFLSSAMDDLWADPVGSYLALKAAAPAWPDSLRGADVWPDPPAIWEVGTHFANGHLGYQLRAGDHALTPRDWAGFLAFLDETGF